MWAAISLAHSRPPSSGSTISSLLAASAAYIAVRTHGYVLLTPEQELEVGKRCKPINPKDGPIDDPFARRDGPLAFDRPVHAIVKDLVNGYTCRTTLLHARLGGPAMERSARSPCLAFSSETSRLLTTYLGGKLIDFSRAWTVPHPPLDHTSPWYLERQRHHDPHDLQECIVDLARALPRGLNRTLCICC